jgi:UDP-N-acetylmuramoyl-L-alanyl-D-glutamate--2,6-diaminopimelate ligase
MEIMIKRLKGLYHLLIALFANLWFSFPGKKITVIGVTGTDGKTTTTTLIYKILKDARKRVSMITSVEAVIAGKTYDTGFHVTTPSTWQIQKFLREAVDHGDTHMVLEVTSHGLAQHRVFGIPFAVGVITNVTHEHLDWHRTFSEYLLTKISLLRRAEVAVINHDETRLYRVAMPLLYGKRLVTYGIHRRAHITPKTHAFNQRLPGEYNKYNCLAAVAVSDVLGIPFPSVKKTIVAFSGVTGRMEIVAVKPVRIIVDFAHTPNAIDQVLKTVRPQVPGRLIHVFGSAGLRDRTKRPLMGKTSAKYADIIILTEEDYRTENVDSIIDQIQQGIHRSTRVYSISDRSKAIEKAIRIARKDDLIILTGKGHEKSLCRGKKEYPWSDTEAVKRILKKL